MFKLNWSIVVLGFVVVVILGNSLLKDEEQTQITSYHQEIGRVISKTSNPSFFSNDYIISIDNQSWFLQTPKYLPIGRFVKLAGDFRTYDYTDQTNVFNQSRLSQGVVGEIKKSTIEKIGTNCDAICWVLSGVSKTKDYVNNTYYYTSCVLYKEIVEFMVEEGNCDQVSALATGLVIGGTEGFSQEMRSNIKVLGLTHLVAVSGFQVVLLTAFIEAIMLRVYMSRKTRVLISFLFLFLFILLVGFQPPVLRSALSIGLSTFFLVFFGRKIASWRALLYSSLVLLLLNPLFLFSVSFQLSFLASVGLLYASAYDKVIAGNSWKILKELVLASFWTFVWTLPVIIYIAGKISFFSVISNILLIACIPFITILNILGLIPYIGELFLILSLSLQAMLVLVIQLLAQTEIVKNLVISFDTLQWWEIVLYYGTLVMLLFVPKLTLQKPKN